jgi:hypothetical protein
MYGTPCHRATARQSCGLWIPTDGVVQDHISLFGIAKRSPARRATKMLGRHAVIMLWVLDTVEELEQACNEGASLIVTNRPLHLLASRAAVQQRCSTPRSSRW